MLKNYFKIASRSLLRKRVFSGVNILGLSVGLASVMIISTYLISELGFDRQHADADSMYRIIETEKGPDQPARDIAQTSGAIGINGEKEVPGVVAHNRVIQLGGISLDYNNNDFEDDFICVDANFFSFFDYKLISGSKEGVFANPLNVVMSESMAKKYFGEESAVGKKLTTTINNTDYEITVSGLMEDMPQNSHLNFEMLFGLNTAMTFFNGFEDYTDNNWQNSNMATYVKLSEGVSQEAVAAGITSMVVKNRPPREGWTYDFNLQPLTDIHFGSANIDGDMNYREGDLSYVYIFGFIGLLILAIAFTNYVNLSTIKATDRIKEIGLRRVVGANRSQLIAQFMSESVFISFISFILAVTFLQFCDPLVVLLFGYNLLENIYNVGYMSAMLGIVIVLGLSAGLYPALTVLRTQTVTALKNKTIAGSRQTFFKGVVLFQFVTSLVMIVATLVVYNQLNFIANKDLGYDEQALAVIDISSNNARVNQEQILNGFLNDPSVIDASITSRVPGEWKSYYEITIEDKTSNSYNGIPFIGVDDHFLDVFEVDLISGRNFRPDGNDSMRVMINETMARQLGIEHAEGQTVTLTGVKMGAQELGLNGTADFEVSAIIGDFHFQSMRDEIPPMMFGYKNNVLQNIDYFTVKLHAQNMGATMERLKGMMKEYDPSPFGYNFLDSKLERYYLEDTRRSKLFFIAASIAVFIAFIGLFALVHFALQKRLKEMSIRKVLGANVRSLVLLLSSDYLKLLAAALLVAVPVSYWGMSSWLNEFVYRTPIQWWVFGLALAVCLGITAITAFTQINKTARRNPAEILRQD